MFKLTTKNGGEALYTAPSVNVLDVQSEGLLCTSGFDTNNCTELFERLDMEEL